LSEEYFRDVRKNLPIKKPRNYFPKDNENMTPIKTWEGHAKLLFNNWLNYYVNPFQKITDKR
jgi:homoserine O-succinyltransferase